MSTQQPTLERIEVSPSELETDGQNPNEMGERQFEALKENIRKFGFIVPVITDANDTIADGEHRLDAARDLDLDTIPVVQLDIDDPDRRVLRQVMNKLAGDHSIHDDAEEFQRILDAGREKTDLADLLGQSERSIDGVLEMLESESDTDELVNEMNGDSSAESSDGLGSPDALDTETMEFDHECPQCGYEFD